MRGGPDAHATAAAEDEAQLAEGGEKVCEGCAIRVCGGRVSGRICGTRNILLMQRQVLDVHRGDVLSALLPAAGCDPAWDQQEGRILCGALDRASDGNYLT